MISQLSKYLNIPRSLITFTLRMIKKQFLYKYRARLWKIIA
jgi:hypothetical protein